VTSVEGGAGHDTLDLSADTTGVTIDLTEGTADYAGFVFSIESLLTGAGDDSIIGALNPVVINTGDINIGNNVNIGNRNKIGNQVGNNNRLQNKNIYNRPENRSRKAEPAVARENLQRARPAADRQNNVYADKSGAVARRNGNQWETREAGSWKQSESRDKAATRPAATTPSARPSTRPATQPSARPSTRPATQPSMSQFSRSSIDHGSLNRSYQARQTGRSREMSRPNRGGGRRR